MFCQCCRRLLCFLIQKFFIHKNNIAFGSKYLPIFFYETFFVYKKIDEKSFTIGDVIRVLIDDIIVMDIGHRIASI